MIDLKTPREKYQSDPCYHTLVNVFLAQLHAAKFTPSEMREASILASIMYEEQKVHRTMIPEDVEQKLKELHNWANKNID